MFIIKYILFKMTYQSIEKIEDVWYKLIDENGSVSFYPQSSLILVNDESGLLSLKVVGSRKTLGLVPVPNWME